MRLPLLATLFVVIPLATSVAQMPTGPMPMGKMPPGHPAIGQGQGHGTAKAEMNHSGTVEEVLSANPYVYIRVKEGSDDKWLAAPAIDLKPGAAIRWPDGMPMKNFFSKTLQRNFESVDFVEAVEPVPAK